MEDGSPIAGAVVILILLIVKGIISNAKAAISYVNESSVRKKAEDGDEESSMLYELMERPESYIYAIDIIITIISVLCGLVYWWTFSGMITGLFKGEKESLLIIGRIVKIAGVILLVIIVSLFGSLLPKKLAKRNAEKKAYNMVHIMFMIVKIMRPITIFMQFIISICVKLLGIKPEELCDNVTEEGIISMVNEGHEQGVLEESEAKMISNIIEFDEKEVSDVMTHRKKIVAINAEMSFEEAYKFVLEENYSRFPLYEDDIDNIVGILNMKDMARVYATKDYKNIKLKDIARKAHFVPETQNVDVLFNDMKNNKVHMAIVIDEYGQTAGIVAFEDVLEEIVGNIVDEYDVDEKFITKQPNGAFLMRGLTSLDDVEAALDVEFGEQEYDTLNGLIISLLNRIPEEGEKTSVEYMGFKFEVLDVRNKIIRFVRVRKLPQTNQ